MSTSIITDADIPVITRVGTIDNGSDTGSGMAVAIASSLFLSSPALYGGPSLEDFNICGVRSTYQVGGNVDFDNIVTDIPDAARVTKIEIRCLVDCNVQADTDADADNFPTGTVDGYAKAECGASISVPNALTTPNTTSSIVLSSQDVNGAPAASIDLNASVNNAGTIVTKIYDIANDPGQYPLGYITRATLVAQFANQKLLFTGNTVLGIGAARSDIFIASSGASNFNRIYSILASINASVWTMTVTWELPFNFQLLTPTDPIEEDDIVEATSHDPDGIDYSQLLTAALEWTDSDGNFHSIDIPSIRWIIFTLHFWRFTVPAGVNGQIVEVVITSTQFSGSVTLGKLVTLFFLNATGIYTITAGKTNDTIYDNDNGGTVDVKIPNPFWKTGFVGG